MSRLYQEILFIRCAGNGSNQSDIWHLLLLSHHFHFVPLSLIFIDLFKSILQRRHHVVLCRIELVEHIEYLRDLALITRQLNLF